MPLKVDPASSIHRIFGASSGKCGERNIIRHSMYKTRQGRRRRYLCKTCKKTFCSTKRTPYYRLHKSRSDFDEVVQMTVEGVGISSISRIKCFSWNTIASWQYLACLAAGKFNDQNLKGVELIELQADEICTFAGTKKKPMWIFVAIEVWSRIWISKVVGSRNYKNVKTLLNQVIDSCQIVNPFIFTTDGFEPQETQEESRHQCRTANDPWIYAKNGTTPVD